MNLQTTNGPVLNLSFKQAKTEKDIKDIFDHTIDAFSDTPDFHWNLSEIKKEVKDGWQLYACQIDKEIIAALFLKIDGKVLLSKNTAIKMNYHGSGYSHQIKEFLEKMAGEKQLKEIRHYCRIDNFRMYSLNESHGYEKTDRKLGDDGQIVEWVKIFDGKIKVRGIRNKK